MSIKKILEELANVEHNRWSGWQSYLHSKCIKNKDGSLTIPAGYVSNLERLIKTPYNELTEKEKGSDRVEARKSLLALKSEMMKVVPDKKKKPCPSYYVGGVCSDKFIEKEKGILGFNRCRIQTQANIEKMFKEVATADDNHTKRIRND